jgi:hypothetical protein
MERVMRQYPEKLSQKKKKKCTAKFVDSQSVVGTSDLFSKFLTACVRTKTAMIQKELSGWLGCEFLLQGGRRNARMGG